MSTAVLKRQPIAGVSPPQTRESTIMAAWPSLAPHADWAARRHGLMRSVPAVPPLRWDI